jgi:hypothetical protein
MPCFQGGKALWYNRLKNNITRAQPYLQISRQVSAMVRPCQLALRLNGMTAEPECSHKKAKVSVNCKSLCSVNVAEGRFLLVRYLRKLVKRSSESGVIVGRQDADCITCHVPTVFDRFLIWSGCPSSPLPMHLAGHLLPQDTVLAWHGQCSGQCTATGRYVYFKYSQSLTQGAIALTDTCIG